MDYVEILCKNIKIIMNIKGLTFADLSRREPKLSTAYGQKIKDPSIFNPTVRTLELLAKALEVPAYELLNPNYKFENSEPLPNGYEIVEAVLTTAEAKHVRIRDEHNRMNLFVNQNYKI